MAAKVHHIHLMEEERTALEKVSASNRRSEREKKRARILLLCDANISRVAGGSLSDAQVAARLHCHKQTVLGVRRGAWERDALSVVERAEQTRRKARKLDGGGEAHLVALTCSAPPAGFARWSLRLLGERLIEMEVVDSIAQETIRETLKKTN